MAQLAARPARVCSIAVSGKIDVARALDELLESGLSSSLCPQTVEPPSEVALTIDSIDEPFHVCYFKVSTVKNAKDATSLSRGASLLEPQADAKMKLDAKVASFERSLREVSR